MKKALIAAALGFAAIVTSHAQGHIIFDNYDSSPYMPVTYNGPGTGVADSSIHVDLLFANGITSNPGALTDLGLSVPINPSLVDALPAANHGYFQGGVVNIPGYVSGPVTFEVEAWQTTGPNGGSTFATSSFRATSALWQESSLAFGTTPANFFAGLPGPDGAPLIVFGPEPSVYALFTMAGASLVFIRRKKKMMPS